MILLALLLLAVAVFLVAVAIMDGGSTVTLDVFDRTVDTPLWGVFVAGVLTGLIALGGLMMFTAGVRRSRERRREIEYLRRKVAQQDREAEKEADDAGSRDWIEQSHPNRQVVDPPTAAWTPEPTGGPHRASRS